MAQIETTPRLTEGPPEEDPGGTSGGGGKTGRTRPLVLDELQPEAEPEEQGGGNPGGGHGKTQGDREKRLDPRAIEESQRN